MVRSGLRYGPPFGQGLTLALVAALVAVTVSGAGLAYAISHGRSIAGVGVAAGTATVPDSAVGVTVSPASASGSVAPPVGTGAGENGAGPVEVSLSPSAEGSAYARDVADLIARYFGAINRHDYDAWLTTVTTAQARRDRDSWTTDYSTTRDFGIYISDITPGDPLTVRMQFTSSQALQFAPAGLRAECVRWDVTYEVLDEGVGLRVGTSAKKPAMASC